MLKKIEIKSLLFLFGVLIISLVVLLANDYFFAGTKNIEEEVQVEKKQIKSEILLKIENAEVKIELALNGEERTQGLSGRDKLDSNSGLLFVFEKSYFYGFWMKEMNFPIDIIWFDENFVVVDMKKAVEPSTFPEIFYPQEKAIYVLEVNSGFSDQYGIKIGSQAEFLGNLNF